MKYLYTRKEAIELARNKGYGFKSLEKLLLAKEDKKEYGIGTIPNDVLNTGTNQKDKKECKHKWHDHNNGFYKCLKCGILRDRTYFKPTPSPLDSIEEVEEILGIDCIHGSILTEEEIKINSLSRNQTKIINYLKGKK